MSVKVRPDLLRAELEKRASVAKKAAEAPKFVLEDFCFPEQLAFIKDPSRFKDAVCSRRCLAKGTLVQTESGPKAIELIVAGDFVYDEHGQLIKVKAVFENGIKTVVEVLHNGKLLLECTPNHVFLTQNTYKNYYAELPLKKFNSRTKIVRNEIDRNSGTSVRHAYAIGALLGDGCSKEGGFGSITISSENELIPNAVALSLGATKVKKQKGNNFSYQIYSEHWPEEYMMWCHGKYAHEKTVDVSRLLSWDRQSRLAFIAGLLDTDGSVSNQPDGLQIDVCMQALPVIQALQVLFLDLWQFSPSFIVDDREKYKNGPVYGIRFKHNYFGKKILKDLTPFLQTERKKYKAEYEHKKENNYVAHRVGVKIGASRLSQTYDLHVESATNLYTLANGLITHNSGKTIACAADLMYTASTMPGDVAYITLSRVTAKKIIWRELTKINDKYQLGGKLDNTELSLSMPNGNMVYVTGAKDAQEAEKLRGLSLRKVYIDESQAFRPYIKDMIEDIIEPALTDYYGSLCLIGTPGPIPAGFFYETSHSKGWSHHKWTMQDNPHIQRKSGKNPLDIIKELAERRGLTLEDASIQREFFGKWVKDVDSLVYHFDPVKNLCLQLPALADMTFIFGIDIGYKDADAIAVLGYDNRSKNVYLVEEYVQSKNDITTLVQKIESLRSTYNPVRMVMDAGALGKKIQEEIRHRHGVPVQAADKARKLEFITLLNDDLRTGKLQAVPRTRFEEDCALVQWDWSNPEKPKISDVYHTDIGDAVLYAWRECKHYFYEAPQAKLSKNSDAYMKALEEQEAEAMELKKRSDNDLTDVQSWEDIGVTDDFIDDF